jgi:hypothetical protein
MPTPPPVAEESAPRPKATAGAVRQASPQVAAAASEAAPRPTEAPPRELAPAEKPTDADILGLTRQGHAAPPAPPREPEIETLAHNPSDPTRKLQAHRAALDVRSGELLGEKGDIIKAADAQRHKTYEASATEGAEHIRGTKERGDLQHRRFEETRAQWQDEQKQLQEKMGNPPFNTSQLIFGLLGAFAAAGGKEATGNILANVIGPAMSVRLNRWKSDVEGGKQHLDGMGKLLNMDRLNAADEDEKALAVHKAAVAEFDSALAEGAKQATTAQQLNNIAEARVGFQKELVDHTLQVRAKAAQAEYERKVTSLIANAKTQEEADYIAKSHGAVGHRVLARNLKNQTTEAKLGSELLSQPKTIAETNALGAKADLDRAKVEAAAAKGQEAPWAPQDWVAPPGLTPQILAKVADEVKPVANLEYVQGELLKIAEQVKSNKLDWTDPNVKARVDRLRVLAVPMGTQAAGAGAPNAGEFDRFMGITADPQEYFKRGDSYNQLRQQYADTQQGYANYMQKMRFTKEPKGGAAPPAGGTPAKRVYRFSDGVEQPLSPDDVEALQRTGSKLELVE